jgi:hypothetical protein
VDGSNFLDWPEVTLWLWVGVFLVARIAFRVIGRQRRTSLHSSNAKCQREKIPWSQCQLMADQPEKEDYDD